MQQELLKRTRNGKPKAWIRSLSKDNHLIGLGNLAVETKGLTASDFVKVLTSIPPGSNAGAVREFAFRVGDSCGWWQEPEKPKRKYKTRNRPTAKDADAAARKTG